MSVRRGQLSFIWAALVLAAVLLLAGRAAAQDPAAGLSEAEARAAAAKSEVEERRSELMPLQAHFESAQKRAAPARAGVRRANEHLAALQAEERAAHRRARATLNAIGREQRDAADDHAQTVRSGIGFGIAACVIGLIALAWGWFRASSPVAYLARIQLGQAIGLCVGGGFVTIVLGTVLSNVGGVLGVIGVALACLGLALPVALLLARHSAEVQRGRSRALLKRERMSARVTQGLAAVFTVLFLLGLGSAIFAGESKSREVSAELLRRAEHGDISGPALAAAEADVATMKAAAAKKLASVNRRRAELRAAKRSLGHAEATLASAEHDRHRFEKRLAVLEEREIRQREREEREAAQLVAREEREAREAEEQAEEEAAEECNPNYSGCLDPFASDYDCAGGSGDGPLYTGTVEVIGYDEYGLDDDGDGIGCDP